MPTVRVEQALNAAPADVGRLLSEVPEDQWFERKSARIAARELANTLIGFGNADGGHVVVGLSDGQVEGTDSDPRRRNDQMQAAIDLTQPPVRARSSLVECLDASGRTDHLLVFTVEPGETMHANTKDEVYLRVGDENRRLTFAQRQELGFDKGEASYESRPSPATSTDLDEALVSEYAEAVRAPDAHRLLQARGLADDGRLTNAGCLLFAAEPQRHFPEAFVRVLRHRGLRRESGARQQVTADVKVEGPIPHQLMEARQVVADVQPTRRALRPDGRFGPVPLVPEDAWLEGLVNAAVHRSYSLAGDHIRVEVFDDRIEISSPGRFPGLADLSDPRDATRFARNPRIARVCADLNFGQELGEGIRRMFDEMSLAGLELPMYKQSAAGVRLTLSAEPADRAIDATLPAETRAIRAALRERDRLSTAEIAEAIGLSRPTTLNRLRALEASGMIAWVGKSPTDPRAYWTLPPP
ncbi:MAG: winged helix-turn-helix transcriptional regulator [Solirubrobacterales bacterium]|nr:winged helix-turn-helix transcriptional regulator [Solirubrobacterales bacterium]